MMVLFLLLIAISIIPGAYFIETAIVISHSNILIALIGNEDSLPGNVRTKTSSACTKLRYPFRRFAKENNHMKHSVLCFSLLLIILACLCMLKMKVKRTHCVATVVLKPYRHGLVSAPITLPNHRLTKYFLHAKEKYPFGSLNTMGQTPPFVTSPCDL